ncbi:MAG: N-acetyl-gamma-glutamyl-phosphate reductase [Paludibacteraceae bacterium]|nr:N-acetyl-gamma-glutamyl-phosphate reductase [Paludibacteraceae bacterium]
MIKAGIIGGAGYTAGELIRLLIHHPQVQIAFVHSTSQAGLPIDSIHEGLFGETDLQFVSEFDLNAVDVLFLCQGHGQSSAFWAEHERPSHLRVIDLAQDYRDESAGYVYGLPEWQRERIRTSALTANPGCFATAIQLALLPLAAQGLLQSEINITAITGSTGAGVKPGPTTHFSWRTDNLSVYKAFRHQHLLEIRKTLTTLQGTTLPTINFIPMRGNMARGILATTLVDCPLTEAEAFALYEDYYQTAAFTFVTQRDVDLKQVTNTNKALVGLQKHEQKLLIVSCIDNLLKGASGQAVQNMNLMFDLPETTGLLLKPNAF